MTFTLFFSDDESLADTEVFHSLDRARDIAFDISLESGREVSVCSGGTLRETVLA